MTKEQVRKALALRHSESVYGIGADPPLPTYPPNMPTILVVGPDAIARTALLVMTGLLGLATWRRRSPK